MKARYNYRLYPNSRQQSNLAQVFGCVRVVWNDALAIVKNTPEGQKWPSQGDLKKMVTEGMGHKPRPSRTAFSDS